MPPLDTPLPPLRPVIREPKEDALVMWLDVLATCEALTAPAPEPN